MSVRAKFKVASKTSSDWGKLADGSIKVVETVKLQVVYDGSPENKKFFEASPSGSIDLGILNPEASKQFEIGKEYYVDFTLAEVPAVAE